MKCGANSSASGANAVRMASAGATKTSAGPLPVRSAAMAVPSADVVLIIGILLVGHVVQTRRVDESHRSGRRLAHLDTTQVGSAGTQRRTDQVACILTGLGATDRAQAVVPAYAWSAPASGSGSEPVRTGAARGWSWWMPWVSHGAHLAGFRRLGQGSARCGQPTTTAACKSGGAGGPRSRGASWPRARADRRSRHGSTRAARLHAQSRDRLLQLRAGHLPPQPASHGVSPEAQPPAPTIP